MVSISHIRAYEANKTLFWLATVSMSTLLISSISDVGLPWRVNSGEQDSKKNFNKTYIFRYTPCFLCFFIVKRFACFYCRQFCICFQYLFTKNRKFLSVIHVTVWFRFRIGRHLLQNTCITTASERKLVGMTIFHIDSLILFFCHLCPRLF